MEPVEICGGFDMHRGFDKIPFESNVARMQMGEEQYGDAVSLLEQARQEFFTPYSKAGNRLSR